MDVFDLAAKITLDTSGYDRGLDESEKKWERIGNKIGKTAAGLVTATSAAVTAAAAGIGKIVKSAVDAYGSYEQLVGGVDTLFGESSQTVQDYADRAFATAGLSANAYMETVTSFSASLLQSLGGDTEKAAEYADMAIIDMSDNANKMGTAMAAIQNAYQGFAKQNYTMLDNLKLGYGGTKTEMERLLKDAEKIKAKHGEYAELSIESYADVVEAIHTVQEEMGITGTTAEEGERTITGSLSSVKAAWTNLVVSFASGNGDIGEKLNTLEETILKFWGNISPRITTALGGITEAVGELAPDIVAKLPGMVKEILPGLLSSAGNLVSQFVTVLPSLVQTVSDSLTETDIPDMIGNIADAIIESTPEMVKAGVDLFSTILNDITGIIDKLAPRFPEFVTTLASSIINEFPKIVTTGIDLFTHLLDDIAGIVSGLAQQIPDLVLMIVTKLIDEAPNLANKAVDLFTHLLDDVDKIIDGLNKGAENLIEGLIKLLTDEKFIAKLTVVGIRLGLALTRGIVKAVVTGLNPLAKIPGLDKIFGGLEDAINSGLDKLDAELAKAQNALDTVPGDTGTSASGDYNTRGGTFGYVGSARSALGTISAREEQRSARNVNININGAVDARAVAAEVEETLADEFVMSGVMVY